ncbi:MAG: hypothetical protein ACK526_17270 [Planctomyces sp.]
MNDTSGNVIPSGMNTENTADNTFESLIHSRKAWLESILRPWCRSASLADLRRAELEWTDIAGRASPQQTLWKWAWERFPELIHEGLQGLDETYPVEVILLDGTRLEGFPDGRRSQNGQLFLVLRSGVHGSGQSQHEEAGPLGIDQIQTVRRTPDLS